MIYLRIVAFYAITAVETVRLLLHVLNFPVAVGRARPGIYKRSRNGLLI